ncbi:CLUMA_CG006180, isoform A [Clunio marinus]|uniref:CLUMA_CG006180, isoform A n=1 Tax=Clunio marinus TaxID=568069 RepID=A0A1J1I2K3_9DIPT|nr:CLUMA_CG006180, isoform A [Clunio marinus]
MHTYLLTKMLKLNENFLPCHLLRLKITKTRFSQIQSKQKVTEIHETCAINVAEDFQSFYLVCSIKINFSSQNNKKKKLQTNLESRGETGRLKILKKKHKVYVNISSSALGTCLVLRWKDIKFPQDLNHPCGDMSCYVAYECYFNGMVCET